MKASNRYREAAIQRAESFAFETVMSHPSKLAALAQLRAQGDCVQLLFVSTTIPTSMSAAWPIE